MSFFYKIVQLWNNPNRFYSRLLVSLGPILPSKVYLSCLVRVRCGYWPNWEKPQTFNEKLQWLKLYNHCPEYVTMVDKFAVKGYVANVIGEDFIIPTLGVWDKPEDIEWDVLPNRFVLKTTHGGGNSGVVICKDKFSIDKHVVIRKLNKSMKQDIYLKLREWPYKNVPRRIIAEEYIEPAFDTKDLPDYKFFCFNGEPQYCQVISGRWTSMCVDFFDKEWKHQPFHEPSYYPFAIPEPEKPPHLEMMWDAARKLAKGIPFCRIDFYDKIDHTYFGEITFFPTSGLGSFAPKQYNEILGQMIDLPEIVIN